MRTSQPASAARQKRASRLTPEQRREALLEATIPLLYEHGRNVTTKQIANAAAVAEGTIFRVFDTKDDLVDEAIVRAFSAESVSERIREIDPARSLRDKALAVTTIYQQRFRATFALMSACGLVVPPTEVREDKKKRFDSLMAETVSLFDGNESELVVTVEQMLHLIRLLTFSGSHPEIAAGGVLSPAQIVDVVLDGVARRDA